MYPKPFAGMVHVTHTVGNTHWFISCRRCDGRETCILLVMYPPIYKPGGYRCTWIFSTFLSMMIIHNICWLTLLFATTTAALAADHYKIRQVGAANTPEYSIYFGKSYIHVYKLTHVLNMYFQRMKMAYLYHLSMICHFALTPLTHPYITWLSRSLDGIMQS